MAERTPDSSINQPPPLVGYDLYAADPVLPAAVAAFGAGWAGERLSAIGRAAGTAEVAELAAKADANPPVALVLDRAGERLDEVDFHPAWHQLLGQALGFGLHAWSWRERRPGAAVARAAGFLVWQQVEAGHGCPVSMTHAAVPALAAAPHLSEIWKPALTSLEYDPGLRPPAAKRGALCGMAMTERQGGSDVRALSTTATPTGDGWVLDGQKWFCSAPMSDAFLVLAQAPGGLSCFLLPRVLPDGGRNGFQLRRLKDKLGNRANASAEVDLAGALADLVGPEGRGVATIVEMVNHTRLDCALGSAGLMRQAVAQAGHHAAHRRAFGRRLAEQPLMANVLADLTVEAEAAAWLAMRLAAAFDRGPGDEGEVVLRRLLTPVAKYWVCKRAPAVAAEALECLGGNGYVEASGLPRLYREAPLNSLWEGAGNVACLDVLRALARQPACAEALMAEVGLAAGADRRLDAFAARLGADLAARADEAGARRLAERIALALQGALLLRHGRLEVAEAFCATRLGGDRSGAFGTLPAGLAALAAIAGPATPALAGA